MTDVDIFHMGLVLVGYVVAGTLALFAAFALFVINRGTAQEDKITEVVGNGVKAFGASLGLALAASILHRLL